MNLWCFQGMEPRPKRVPLLAGKPTEYRLHRPSANGSERKARAKISPKGIIWKKKLKNAGNCWMR